MTDNDLVIENILARCQAEQVQLGVEDGALTVLFDDYPSDALIEQIKAHKPALLSFLSAAKQQAEVGADIPALARDGVDTFELSYNQQRLWFLSELEKDEARYNMTAGFVIEGKPDEALLTRVFNLIVARHEALRTAVVTVGETPMQKILPPVELSIDRIDLHGEDPAQIQRRIEAYGERSFDLSQAPLLRVGLFRRAEEDFVLLLVMHHIISDGWSMSILCEEFVKAYGAMVQGLEAELPTLPRQYADFAAWQREGLKGEALAAELEFWQGKLLDAPTLHPLTLDFTRPKVADNSSARVSHSLSPELSAEIARLCREQDVTPFMFLFTSFALLVNLCGGSKDVVIGTPVAGRVHARLEPIIGFFANTLALRSRFEATERFTEALARHKGELSECFGHQTLPFDLLIEHLRPERDLAYAPVVQLMFALQNKDGETLSLPGLGVSELPSIVGGNKFELELNIVADNGRYSLNWDYKCCLFKHHSIERLAARFERLLQQLTQAPKSALSQLDLLEAEQKTALAQFNQTQVAYDKTLCLSDSVEQHAEQTPDAIAVEGPQGRLSYREFNAKANRLAHHLRERGLNLGDKVVVYLERGLDLPVAILAVLKAGGVLVCVDADWPLARVNDVLSDCGARLVLAGNHLASALDADAYADGLTVIDPAAPTDTSENNIDRQSIALDGSALAYIIYTSGSTGKPKGVMVEHHSVVNLARYQCRQFAIGAAAKVLQFASIAFDAAVSEWATAFYAGASLCLIDKPTILSGKDFGHYLNAHGITHLTLPPAFIFANDSLRNTTVTDLVLAGEAVDKACIAKAGAMFSNARLINAYGATENTVCATINDDGYQGEGTTMPIGRAVDNTTCYVVGELGNLCSVGVAGELYIGGAGIARGYLNLSRLTDEKFIDNPFAAADDWAPRLYRTGDSVRLDEQGRLVFLGRIDQQIKVRGVRVEPGEIEDRLHRLPGINEACVLLKGKGSDAQLVAFIAPGTAVSDDDALALAAEVKRTLGEQLPQHMVPDLITVVEQLPQTANGKIDRKALLSLKLQANVEQRMPRNELEQALADIWAALLGLDTVGIDSGFFDLGGHSLLATRLLNRIAERFGVEVPLRQFFIRPTIIALAEFIAKADTTAVAPLVAAEDPDAAEPLSYAQQRLWFIDQLHAGGGYNITATCHLPGSWQQKAFYSTIAVLLERHQMLRSRLFESDGVAMQQVRKDYPLPINTVDMRHVAECDRQTTLLRLLDEDSAKGFDLGNDLLLRVLVVHLSDDEHVVHFNLHHIAADGWSMDILVEEFSRLYLSAVRGESVELPELSLQYRDFARWQQQWLGDAGFERELSFWRDSLKDMPMLHALPLDRARPARQDLSGALVSTRLDSTATERLLGLCKRQDVTLFMLMQTSWALLLSAYSAEQDIVMGTPVSGRHHAGVESLVGLFLNTLVLRTEVSGKGRFGDLLERNKANLLAAFEHQLVPFEMLVETLRPERSMSHGPLVQLLINVSMDCQAPSQQLDELAITQAYSRQTETTAKYEITLYVDVIDGELCLSWNYQTALFDAATIERMAGAFKHLLERLDSDTDIAALPLAEIDGLSILRGRHQALAYPRVDLWFAAVAKAQAEKVAIRHHGQSYRFGELDRAADVVAGRLYALGVRPGDKVALMMTRGAALSAATIATLRVGAAYVPLHATLPEARVARIVADAGVKVLLCDAAEKFAALGADCQVIGLDDPFAAGASIEPFEPATAIAAEDCAHIIYTSGTTGNPKGVMGTHGALVNRLAWMLRAYPFADDEVAGQVTASGFIRSVWEFWQPLVAGVTTHIVDDAEVKDGKALLRAIDSGITRVVTTPTLALALTQLDGFAEQCRALRYWFVSGEPMSGEVGNRLSQLLGKAVIGNLYGSTEVMSDIAGFEVKSCEFSPADILPVGAAIDNTDILLLDSHLQAVPVGAVGEIAIAGASLAAGYAGVKDERFVESFGRYGVTRLYRSGDLGRINNSGELVCLGRRDSQVKVRGYRIETKEIAHYLLSVEGVKAAYVAAAPGDQLAAFIAAPESQDERAKQALQQNCRDVLARQLPAYMHPSSLMVLDALPLLANGKVDRRALLALERHSAELPYRAPVSESEKALAAILADVLALERIGLDDDFFALGGHSLLLMKVKNQLEHTFKLSVGIDVLFANPTVARLAAVVDHAQRTAALKQASQHNNDLVIGEI